MYAPLCLQVTLAAALLLRGGYAYIEGSSTPSHVTYDYRPEKSFKLQSPERQWLRILDLDFDGYGLFGLANKLLNLSFSSMTGSLVEVQTSAPNAMDCGRVSQVLQTLRSQCNISYVRTLAKMTANKYWIFSSAGGIISACNEDSFDNVTSEWSIGGTCDLNEIHCGTLAPPLPFVNLTYLKTAEGDLYAGGMVMKRSARVRYGVFKLPASRETKGAGVLYSTQMPTGVYSLQDEEAIGDKKDTRIYPNFVQSFETTTEVYWIFSESALESEPFIHRRVSRVGRVCKNDESSPILLFEDYFDRAQPFTTFWKATLQCSIPGNYIHKDINTYATAGFHEFSFNAVAASTRMHRGNVLVHNNEDDTKEMLYAVFNTDRNSILGSAVCAYERAALAAPFVGPIYELTPPETDLGLNKFEKQWNWIKTNYDYSASPPSKHPANCESDERTIKHPQALLAQQASPLSGQPLLFLTSHWYFLSAIDVDWQVRALDGNYYDVLFIGTDDGYLLKVMNLGGTKAINFQILERRRISANGTAGVAELRLIHDSSSQSALNKTLIVNTFDAIYNLPVENCGALRDCDSCISLRDPYCAWSIETQLCVAVTYGFSSARYLQNVWSSGRLSCGGSAGLSGGEKAPIVVGVTIIVVAAAALVSFGAGWLIGKVVRPTKSASQPVRGDAKLGVNTRQQPE